MNGKNCDRRRLGRAVPFAVPIILLAAGCSPHDSTRPDVVRPVKTMVVAAGGETHARSFPGRIEASKKVELAFQVPGLLVKLPVKEGQRVAKGEVIAQLTAGRIPGPAENPARRTRSGSGGPPSSAVGRTA